MNVVLDLDETLINTHRMSKFTSRHQKRAKQFDSVPMEDKYMVIKRPNLDTFLNWLFDNYTVTIWTAATSAYAFFVVRYIIMRQSKRVPLYIFHSEHCDVSQKSGNSHKDLRLLFSKYPDQYSPDNTIIIDDRADVCKAQPNNSYHIPPFLFLKSKSYEDSELDRLKKYLQARTLSVSSK